MQIRVHIHQTMVYYSMGTLLTDCLKSDLSKIAGPYLDIAQAAVPKQPGLNLVAITLALRMCKHYAVSMPCWQGWLHSGLHDVVNLWGV